MAGASFRRQAATAGVGLMLAGVALSAQPFDRAAPSEVEGQTPRPGQLAPLPLTQLDERTSSADLDTHTFTLAFTQPMAVRELLPMLVRDTNLSIVSDPAIAGTFIGELKNVTVRQALDLVLGPLGLDYSVNGTFVRVFRREPETRIFDINYIATERIGSTTIGSVDGSGASVSSTTKTDLFADLASGVRTLLSERATYNVDRKAGLLQVTDFPERLDRVAVYLDAVQDRVQRQMQIDARVVEVELDDEKATGVDWNAVAMRTTDVTRLLAALGEQGKVTVVAHPRLFALNNEPAIVRTDAVTFSVTPQISGDGIVMMSLSPVVNAPAAIQSDLLARVADGETLVVSGFTRDRETRERKAVGISGGWFGRSTVVTRKRIELLILLTPKIVSGATGQ